MMASRVSEQLAEIMKQHGFTLPDRSQDEYSEQVEWRYGSKPDYTKADVCYMKGKSCNHAASSMETLVENLVKRWEMELTHIVNYSDVATMKMDEFKLKVNNGEEMSATELMTDGSYNSLLKDVSKDLYDSDSLTLESSQEVFRNAFEEGFGWEVLQVFSGPPRVAFTWRHWGKFTGEYKGHKGDGRVLEMYGFTVADVNEDSKMTRVELYYKPEGMLKCLEGKMSPSEVFQGKALFGSCCPIHKEVK